MAVEVMGAVGFTSGPIRTLSTATSEHSEHVTAMVGLGESLHNIALALVMATLAGIAASVGSLRLWIQGARSAT